MTNKRLQSYFNEANRHIDLIRDSLEELTTPIESYEELPKLQKFALNALIFRFSKLQDLIGAKIFRLYLEFNGFLTANISYFDILKEIEKEGVVDIDSWGELRELRNKIAHDYPQELEEMIESINLFIDKSQDLIDISQKLEHIFNEIKRKRDKSN